MRIAIGAVTVALATAAMLALVRIARGPSLLDRLIAVEVLLSVVMGAIGTEAAVNRRVTTVPILVVLAVLGFVGSVSVARLLVEEQR